MSHTCFVLVTLLATVATLSRGFNLTSIVPLIKNLSVEFKLETVVIFKSGKCSSTEFCELRAPVSTPVMLLSVEPSLRLKNMLGRKVTLSIILVEIRGDSILKLANNALKGMRLSRIIIVLGYDNVHLSDLKKMFYWCWEQNMLNTIIIYENKENIQHTFSYNPFPHIALYNITGQRIQDAFHSKVHNLNGYKFRSPIKLDMPRVFKFRSRSGKQIVTGIAGRVLIEFIKKLNGTFEEMQLPDSTHYASMTDMFKLILLRKIDISIHPYGHFNRSLSTASYPLSLPNWCVMVPVVSEIPSFLYLVFPFKLLVWLYILIGVILLAIARYFAACRSRNRITLGKAFGDSIRTILYVSIPAVKIQNRWQVIFIYVIALLQGFMLTNLYLASLTSFFTKTVYGRQIDTPKDLIESGLKIMIERSEEKTLNELINFPRELKTLLLPVDADTLAQHREKLNTTYSYTVATERWNYLAMQEQYLHRKSFRLSNICFGQFFLSYPMQLDSPFMEALGIFIIRARQYGIFDKWESKTFKEGLDARLLHIKLEPEHPSQPMNANHFLLLWCILALGYIMSFCCFLGEHLYYYFKQR